MRLTDFWFSEEWARYERACGYEGQRLAVLAKADWQTRVLDLSVAPEALYRGVRKSYRQSIEKAMSSRRYTMAVMAPDMFVPVCRKMHAEQAGKETRPIESWEIQREWLETGKAFCLYGLKQFAEDEKGIDVAPAGFVYAVTDGRWAYYFSGVSQERDGLMHLMQWSMAMLLQRSGVRFYELGWQGEALDDKGKAIEFFKRGFGGADVPAQIGVN